MMDLRDYLAGCRNKIVIRKTTNCAHEAPVVVGALEARNNFDAVLFRSVIDNNGMMAGWSLLVNLFARRDSVATMLASAGMNDLEAFNRRIATDGKLQVVGDAPVRQTIVQGDAIDLNSIPVVTHHERDAGPYLTAGVVVVKDPETGVYNAAIQRLLVHDRITLGIFMVPTGHNKIVQQKYAAAGKDMPVAIIVGHHPLFYLGMQTKEPLERDEYLIAASLMGGALRVAPSETFPELLIPADAELVLEGLMLAQGLRIEGPFGEYSHYYSAPEPHEYITVKAILHRRDPIFLDIFACHRDHHLLEGTLMTAQLTQVMRAQYPEFVRLSLPFSGCCQFYCYVSIRNRPGLDLKKAGLYILNAQEYIKYVVFVDEDIDVDNEPEVLWAIATRATLSQDLLLTHNTRGTMMDPTVKGEGGPERGVLDATAKDPEMLGNRVRLAPKLFANLDLDHYLK